MFINLLFLVLTITLKLQSENLYRIPIDIPMRILSFGRETSFKQWQVDSLECGKLTCDEQDYQNAVENLPETVGLFFRKYPMNDHMYHKHTFWSSWISSGSGGLDALLSVTL